MWCACPGPPPDPSPPKGSHAATRQAPPYSPPAPDPSAHPHPASTRSHSPSRSRRPPGPAWPPSPPTAARPAPRSAATAPSRKAHKAPSSSSRIQIPPGFGVEPQLERARAKARARDLKACAVALGRGTPQDHFCNSVQIAVMYSCALPVQVGRKTPAALCSSGITTSGAVCMSSGMKASDPEIPFA